MSWDDFAAFRSQTARGFILTRQMSSSPQVSDPFAFAFPDGQRRVKPSLGTQIMTSNSKLPMQDFGAIEAQAKAAMNSWMTMQRPMFTMMTEINGRLIDQAFRVNTAWFGFMGRCIEHEIEATRRLMGCRNVNELMTTYRDVVDTAQRDVRVEVEQLSLLNRELAGETVAAFREGLEEAAQELRH